MANWTWSVRIVQGCISLLALPLFYRRESIAADDVLLGTGDHEKARTDNTGDVGGLIPLALSIAVYVGVAVFYVPWSQAGDAQGWVSLQSLDNTSIAGIDADRPQVPNGVQPVQITRAVTRVLESDARVVMSRAD